LFDVEISEDAKKLLQHRGKNEIAFRIPDDEQLIELMKKINVPLIAPSANPEGKPPPKNIQEAIDYFGEKIKFKILREGNVSYNKIKEILEGKDVKNP